MPGSEEERLRQKRTTPLFNVKCFSLSLTLVVSIYLDYSNGAVYVQEPGGAC